MPISLPPFKWRGPRGRTGGKQARRARWGMASRWSSSYFDRVMAAMAPGAR